MRRHGACQPSNTELGAYLTLCGVGYTNWHNLKDHLHSSCNQKAEQAHKDLKVMLEKGIHLWRDKYQRSINHETLSNMRRKCTAGIFKTNTAKMSHRRLEGVVEPYLLGSVLSDISASISGIVQ